MPSAEPYPPLQFLFVAAPKILFIKDIGKLYCFPLATPFTVPHCYFEQWGSGAPGTITYPIEFTSAFIAIATPANGSPNEIGITNLKTNSFHVENWSSSRPAYNDYWIAIGI